MVACMAGSVECHERALLQFVPHAALGHEGEAKAGLRQPLLCRQTIDQGQVGVLQAGADELPRQKMAG